MNAKIVGSVVVVLALFAAGFLFFNPSGVGTPAKVDAARLNSDLAVSTDASSRSSIIDSAQIASVGSSTSTAKQSIARRPKDIAREIILNSVKATDAVVSIRANTSISPADRAFYLALLASTCEERGTPQAAQPVDTSDPSSVARARLAERRSANFCVGMDVLTAQQIAQLWKQAADAGDSRAVAFLGWQDFAASFVKGTAPGQVNEAAAPEQLSAAMTQKLVSAISTKDPTAIGVLGTLLAQTTRSSYLATDSGVAISALPAETWSLLACGAGMDCGRDNTVLLAACGREGKCGFESLEDFYRKQVWTPDQAATFDAARNSLTQLIQTGDASRLRTMNFDNNSTAPRFFYTFPPTFRIYR